MANAQVYDAGFVKPMDMPFNLAGSFGEPRPDHFHSGIDIKTHSKEGYPVFAIGDGYISRIKVSPYGYGKAIYVSHPNGYTSVYAHLSEFNAEIEKYVHQQHYLKKTSELDIYLAASLFKLKQNDTIAFSGNTGGSSAPHLHFEIRDSKTEHALNPLDFYPRSFYVDTIPPQLNKVKVYQFDKYFYDSNSEIIELIKTADFYTTFDQIVVNGYKFIGISLEGFDKQDSSANKNGIYKMEVLIGMDTIFKYVMNEVDFEKTRMCNAFIDYREMIHEEEYFYNCFKLKYNTNKIFITNDKDGFVKTVPGISNTRFKINCYDYNLNVSTIFLNILYNPGPDTISPYFWSKKMYEGHSIVLNSNSPDSVIVHENFKINFLENTFYDVPVIESGMIVVHGYDKSVDSFYSVGGYIPLNKQAKIEFTSYVKNERNKVTIIRQNHQGKETALKTTFDKTKFYAETKELGTFYLKYDTTKPLIQLEEIAGNKIIATITDELSGIQSYNGYIDGQWVNFYYDAKNDRITYTFDEYCKPGEHTLKLVVSDAKQNTNTITQKFKY